jgi:hypothetical protein
MSAVPPKAEVDSGRQRRRHGPFRVDGIAVDVIQASKPEPRTMRNELRNDGIMPLICPTRQTDS